MLWHAFYCVPLKTNGYFFLVGDLYRRGCCFHAFLQSFHLTFFHTACYLDTCFFLDSFKCCLANSRCFLSFECDRRKFFTFFKCLFSDFFHIGSDDKTFQIFVISKSFLCDRCYFKGHPEGTVGDLTIVPSGFPI